MTLALSRALMTLTCRCLGNGRRAWAHAMSAEFDVAAENGRALPFALGCFFAALRQMPTRSEGRFVLTNYAVALIVLLPMAAIEISTATMGVPHLFNGQDRWGVGTTQGQMLLVGDSFRAAWPSLTLLLLVSGGTQVRLAWLILERDWHRAISTGIAILATITTLVLALGCLLVDVSQAITLGGALGIELAMIAGLGSWHADLDASPS